MILAKLHTNAYLRLALRGAQILITIILMEILVRSVNWSALSSLFANINWLYIGFAAVILLFSHLINVARWRYVLQDTAISYGRLLIFYGAGFFSNNFLPTGIGGDGVRAVLLGREVSLSRSFLSVGIDRVSGLLSLPIFIIPGLLFGLPPDLHDVSKQILSQNLFKVVIILSIILFVSIPLILLVWTWCPSLRNKIQQMSGQFFGVDLTGQLTFHLAFRLMGSTGSLSILSNSGTICAHHMVLHALHIDISFGAAIWLVLAGTAALLLPIAINGLGVMEGIFVVVLTGYGVDATTALGVALIIRMLILFYSLIGGLLSLPLDPQLYVKAIVRRPNV